MNKKAIFYLVMFIFVLVVLLGAGELITRINENQAYRKMLKGIEKSIYAEDPEIGFRFIPYSTVDKQGYSIEINSEGFRDAEHSQKKKKFRILALGDSFLFGWKMSYQDMFITQLEDSFKGKVEIVKMGIPGNGTAKNYKVLKYKGLKYKPDLIILNFYMGSDFIDDLRPPDRVINNNQTRALPFEAYENVGGKIYSYSKLRVAHFLRWRWTRWLIMMRRGQNFFNRLFIACEKAAYDNILRKLLNEHQRAALETNIALRQKTLDIKIRALKERNQISKYLMSEMGVFYNNYTNYFNKAIENNFKTLKEMNNLAKANNAEFVIVFVPSDIQINSILFKDIKIVLGLKDQDYDVLKPNKLLMSFCTRNNIRFIDLFPYLKDAYNKGIQLYLPDYDRHWTVEGHKIVARGLEDGLNKLNFQPNLQELDFKK